MTLHVWTLVTVLWVSIGCLEIVWRVFGNCLEGVWQVYSGCLEGVWEVPGRGLKGVWRVSMRFPNGKLVSQDRSCQVRIGQVRIGQVRTGQVRTGQVWTGQELNMHLRMEFDSGVGLTCLYYKPPHYYWLYYRTKDCPPLFLPWYPHNLFNLGWCELLRLNLIISVTN